jgi:hypothetical protein
LEYGLNVRIVVAGGESLELAEGLDGALEEGEVVVLAGLACPPPPLAQPASSRAPAAAINAHRTSI